MPFFLRPRRPGTRASAGKAALTVTLLALIAASAACSGKYPESVFHSRTDFNRDTSWLFWLIIWVGLFVFVFVEALLLGVMWKYRSRPGQREPEHVHGNTTLEIAWTAIPAIILIIICVPTVKTIFRTQAAARSDALQVDVIGHQWWWEFRYPQYGFSTANEVYMPIGRTVNFSLRTADVIHSFWIAALGGKRDLVHKDKPNFLWFTPDSAEVNAWNGVCVEYCGASHANMRFRAFTVSPEDFESWANHQKSPAIVLNAAPTQPPAANEVGAANAQVAAQRAAGSNVTQGTSTAGPIQPQPVTGSATTPSPTQTVMQTGFVSFPMDKIPEHVKPNTPIPAGITVDESVQGDAARGETVFKGAGMCIGCHTVNPAIPTSPVIAPNLSHIGSRSTIAAGLWPNDKRHLTAWVSNAPLMKPGVIMPTLAKSQTNPRTKAPGTLDPQQIADVVAYLMSLK